MAVLFPGDRDNAWGASAEVLRQELADDGYAVEVRFAGDDIPTQLEQLRDVLEAAPVAVVIAPVDATAIAAVLDEEAAPEVAVIAYDELIVDSQQVDYFATFDHRAAGRLRAEAFVEALGLDAPADAVPDAVPVELLAGSGDDRGARDAFAGALETLQPYLDSGRLVVPSGRIALEQTAVLRGDPATAAERIAELLDEGVPLAGVLSPSDAMSAAIAELLLENGRGIVPAGDTWSATPLPPEGSRSCRRLRRRPMPRFRPIPTRRATRSPTRRAAPSTVTRRAAPSTVTRMPRPRAHPSCSRAADRASGGPGHARRHPDLDRLRGPARARPRRGEHGARGRRGLRAHRDPRCHHRQRHPGGADAPARPAARDQPRGRGGPARLAG
ncbi:hypothetical protein GCM10025869_07780 [Homoserinibacter gongjuensis]|uniref:Periplasmic binding protein domain-containing protein n=1 Tax=Homoserinibacter gongjuensis TaxID=1162968 RepID=A0ABQ6JSG2_9MICO|nr:hypothetical protein GCM10025869_07780 [Homoserinibacter gongjuensis]